MEIEKRSAQVWDQMEVFSKAQNNYHMYCVITFDGLIDANKLKKALKLSISVFPILASRYVERFWSPCWIRDEEPTEETVFSLIETGETIHEQQAFYADEINEHTPGQVKAKIIRSCGQDTLCVAMNHMVCDAAGFKEYMYALSDIYNKVCDDENYKPDFVIDGNRSAVRFYKDFIKSQKGLIKKLQVRLGAQKYNEYRLRMPLSQGEAVRPDIVTRSICKYRFEKIRQYGKENGATVNDLFLSAIFRALARYMPEHAHELEVPCMVDLRRFKEENTFNALYNLTSMLLVYIGENIGKNYDETLKNVHDSVRTLMADFPALDGYGHLLTLFRVLPYQTVKKIITDAFKSFPVAYSNLGIIDCKRLEFREMNIANCFMTGSIKEKPFFWVAISTFNNRVTMSVNLKGSDEDFKLIEEFLQTVDSELPH